MQYVLLESRALALAFGVIEALLLMVITLVLLVQGDTAPFLLHRLLPGYTVSIQGMIYAGVVGFVDGAIGGWIFAWIYNAGVKRRAREK